jgi:large subunit ribosomal protein L18e
LFQGIDLEKGGRFKNKKRTAPASANPYVLLLVKLYRFLARRTDSNFNKIVLKRLMMSRINTPPMSIRRIAKFTSQDGKTTDKIIVLVGKVTDDIRMLDCPTGLNICALRFTDAARSRIEAAGGRCLTFDQLALERPTGQGTILLRGPKLAREAVKHFGAPGVPGSHAKPYIQSKGRKFENARGRRKNCGFKT